MTARQNTDAAYAGLAMAIGVERDESTELVADLRTVNGQLVARVAVQAAEIARLQAIIDTANQPPAATTLIGVSMGTGNWGGITGWPAHRVYITRECPADITTHAATAKALADGAKYICLSWKDTNAARVKTMVDSFAQRPDVTWDCVFFHEQEDNMPGSQFLPVARGQRAIVQAAGHRFGPMYQAWTFNPRSRRDWRDWWDEGSDFLGIEAYNPGRKKTPPVFEPPAEFLDRAFAALEETGKPTIAGEFGMPVDPDNPATRPAYIKSIVQYYKDNCPTGVLALLYWDSRVTNDNRLDRAAAEALQSMNDQH